MANNNDTIDILHQNKFGYICKCRCCNRYQLLLGNILLTLTEDEYMKFDHFFDLIYDEFQMEDATNNKRIYVIPTKHEGVELSFNYAEMSSTIELLGNASFMQAVNNCLNFNNTDFRN